jgi:hypothetical protein
MIGSGRINGRKRDLLTELHNRVATGVGRESLASFPSARPRKEKKDAPPQLTRGAIR